MAKKLSTAQGMGATVSDKTITFRVWAPNAKQVFVTGSFNDWDYKALKLKHEANGYWAIATHKARVGDEYKFVIINAESGNELLRNDPYAYQMTNSNGNSVIEDFHFDWEDEGFEIEDWNKLIIYELHVGTFHRSAKDKVGTFGNVIKKLPYLKKLGINVIELLPVAEFAGGISWGYNPAAPFSVENDYGGSEGLANLVNEAHKAGIAVILDVVYNHLGPSDVDLWQFDGWSNNDKGGIYFYNDHRSKTPWGDTRPDYGRPEVRQYFIDNALMWLDKFHLDGLRFDATAYIRYEEGGLGMGNAIDEGNLMIKEINREIMANHPKAITIAEDLKGDENVTKLFADGGLGYGSQWDSKFVHPVREVLEQPNDQDRDLQKIVDALCYSYNESAFQRVVYTESHDEVANGKARVPEEIQPGDANSEFALKRAILGIVLVMTAPGIPMIFQGQEFMVDKFFKDDEGLDWRQEKEHDTITQLFRQLCALRLGNFNSEGLTGQYMSVLHMNQDTKVLAYRRSQHEDFKNATLVVMNFSNTEYTDYEMGLSNADKSELLFNSVSKEYSPQFSELPVENLKIVNEAFDDQSHKAILNIPAYAALIF
ncbi:1,4-alpha-glucan branching protein [Subsaximicrobium wynnwilliamsii]|uniref:1,4-alpha-glucan branching enzyme n=1 Tax=Subsaximicrobium wynnwilliamsii TaxID=291179 RepID=A0A5C6ZFX9_9FLAO|nr:alpha-amylase family glycosyl hydrolase [Subsaximicrobium wynnwilliamsii]TXD82455.1 1,4-alpha-glucan branching protein [Subsaximicrobium wynnwilliamsii]TXD88097.1 1,4-alpha-glucan branching protein [Subsaximicrobium wynnwilliamsii]TXE02041.1 1,4-alpha-glucan branching protein [Subsaximicrobium wynnwilliamsii]